MLERNWIPRPPSRAERNCATHTQETFREDVGNPVPKKLESAEFINAVWWRRKSSRSKKRYQSWPSFLRRKLMTGFPELMPHHCVKETLDRGDIFILPLLSASPPAQSIDPMENLACGKWNEQLSSVSRVRAQGNCKLEDMWCFRAPVIPCLSWF